jgi:hypothetical protein
LNRSDFNDFPRRETPKNAAGQRLMRPISDHCRQQRQGDAGVMPGVPGYRAAVLTGRRQEAIN